MKEITLTPQTIAAMHAYRDIMRDMYEYSGTGSMEGVEFQQGPYTVMADYTAQGEVEEDLMVHTEVAGNNIEDLSHAVCTGVEINNVHAFDDDGGEYEIINRQEVLA